MDSKYKYLKYKKKYMLLKGGIGEMVMNGWYGSTTYYDKTEEYKNINKYKEKIKESLTTYNYGNNTTIINNIINTLNILYCYVEYNKEPYLGATNIDNIYENIDKININVYNFYIVVQIIIQLLMYKTEDDAILKNLLKPLLHEDTHADKVDTNTDEHKKQELKQHEHLSKIKNIMKDLNINIDTVENIIEHNLKERNKSKRRNAKTYVHAITMQLNEIEMLLKQIEQFDRLKSILKKIHIGNMNFKFGISSIIELKNILSDLDTIIIEELKDSNDKYNFISNLFKVDIRKLDFTLSPISPTLSDIYTKDTSPPETFLLFIFNILLLYINNDIKNFHKFEWDEYINRILLNGITANKYKEFIESKEQNKCTIKLHSY